MLDESKYRQTLASRRNSIYAINKNLIDATLPYNRSVLRQLPSCSSSRDTSHRKTSVEKRSSIDWFRWAEWSAKRATVVKMVFWSVSTLSNEAKIPSGRCIEQLGWQNLSSEQVDTIPATYDQSVLLSLLSHPRIIHEWASVFSSNALYSCSFTCDGKRFQSKCLVRE